MNEVKSKSLQFGDDTITFETGKLANLANGSVLAKWGDTVVLITVTMSAPREGIDFFPLTVEYVEKMYAGGIISSSRFVKRERFPSTDATLRARVIDRSIRPLFPEGFKNEVQVVVTVLSYDDVHDPAILATNATSVALMISDIPFEGPIAGVRISKKDGEFVVNPRMDDFEESDLDLIISASSDSIIMIESGADQIEEGEMIKALELAKTSADPMLKIQEEIASAWGKAKSEYVAEGQDPEMVEAITNNYKDRIKESVYIKGKDERNEAMDKLREDAYLEFEGKYSKSSIESVIHSLIENVVVEGVVKEGRRPDGRDFDEVRALSAEVSLLPRTHGSGLFQRGLTQALSTVTLGSGKQEQLVEDMAGETTRRYMHHYNFKPFCVGETGRYSYYPGRREVGHGALGERALLPVIPSQEEFPYTIRVVSEILAANGSTSMAATCGSTLALMDAGVPIKAPVAGIAMGLMSDRETGKTVILTDIQGFEDHFGDMDFKVTGTRKGITALQMDNKLKGISMEVLSEALEKAKAARLKILDLFDEVIPSSRTELSKYAPAIKSIKIDPERIGDVIGPGGKVIRRITEETGAEIDIEEDGTVNIYSPSKESIDKALAMVEEIVFVPEIGEVYEGEVNRIENFGAFVEIVPGVNGLIHISELKEGFVKDPNEVVKMGQKVKAKVIGIDEKGRVSMSLKAVAGKVEETKKE